MELTQIFTYLDSSNNLNISIFIHFSKVSAKIYLDFKWAFAEFR